MKTKLLFVFSFVLSIYFLSCAQTSKTTNGDNSQNAVDWEGSYYGVTPCADCEGIETVITLNKNLSYSIKRKYIGKSTPVSVSSGKFTWTKDGGKISLAGETPSLYQVGENKLIQLDANSKPIGGDLASKFIFSKTMNSITEKYWKLTELNGQPVTTAEGKKEAHMILKKLNNQVKVFAGCNNFVGTYELKAGDKIKFNQMAGTLMACVNMETESGFTKVLETADGYILNGDTLVLIRARMAPLARFEAVYFQ